MTLEGGYLQLVYGSELGLVGTDEVPGTRITLCLYNHCLTIDFPPIIHGIRYDLRNSCSAMLWPSRLPAGIAELNMPYPTPISDVLLAICKGLGVGISVGDLAT